ncbi:C-type lectin domain family 4 member C-like isoform 5-T5 [Trichechus inunguis]
MVQGQPQGRETEVWWHQVKVWSAAVVSLLLLSACFIVSCLDWHCCPTSWSPFQSSCYFISTELKNCTDSEKNCSEMGAHLMMINTKEEQQFIIQKLDGNFAYYVGLSDPEGKRQWQWVDQSPYNAKVTFWHPGEPNMHDEHCVIINYRDGNWGWNDAFCDVMQRSICEMMMISL